MILECPCFLVEKCFKLLVKLILNRYSYPNFVSLQTISFKQFGWTRFSETYSLKHTAKPSCKHIRSDIAKYQNKSCTNNFIF